MRLTDPAARKDQHLDVILAGKARHGLDSGFSAVRFVHEALPDLDHGKIDLGVDFLGRRLKAPPAFWTRSQRTHAHILIS